MKRKTIQNSLNLEYSPYLGLLNQSFDSSETFVCLIFDMTQHQPVRVCKRKNKGNKNETLYLSEIFLTALFELFLI